MSTYEKSAARARYELMLYWSAVAWDVARPGSNKGIYILGYIKSGTNWLSHLVSTATGLPINEVWKFNLPMLKPCVHHMHRFIPIDGVRRRTIYMMRDGRDTLVSAYFHLVREGGPMKISLEHKLGRPICKENIRENLAQFLEVMRTNRTATIDYRSHIEEWKRHRDRYATVRYEDLLADAGGELSRVLHEVTGKTADPARVRDAVARFDFSRITGRSNGKEDDNHFVRKGISGDWRNHFTREAALAFDRYAGDLLRELGYEEDPRWAYNF